MKKSKQYREFFSHSLRKLFRTIKIELVIITALMYALLILTSCRNSEKNQKQVEQNHPQQEEENHNHEHSGHSQQMNETRDWLKQELGEKYNQPVSPSTEEQLVQGKNIFTKYCITCHGSSGKGDGPGATTLQPKPADFTDPEHSSFYSNQGRIYLIKKGMKGTAMAAWENILSEEEILSVYAYVNSLKNSGEMMEHHEQNH
ncbi:cytochrome c [Flavobacterium rhamnosiphilum]|uniref:Cytochrome c n=1 Tax=Flavobacterium rhamnosiphilum TaxID=2541724 RepID=A0A4R5FA41_9FLAO|nr:cytochrome c [Flavobacterium rhamnosiphilum]TDE44982.1 cytochrome c [Flavobacterium rhamnosiphilum]